LTLFFFGFSIDCRRPFLKNFGPFEKGFLGGFPSGRRLSFRWFSDPNLVGDFPSAPVDCNRFNRRRSFAPSPPAMMPVVIDLLLLSICAVDDLCLDVEETTSSM
jgi:hypothetical protein